MHKIGGTQVDSFTWAYLTAAFWTSGEEEFPEYCYSGEFSINESDVLRLAPGALALTIIVCQEFQDLNADLLEASMLSDDQAGHDFWLTRNRSGAGFMDRGVIGGNALTEAAHNYGEVSLIKGDDGLLYIC